MIPRKHPSEMFIYAVVIALALTALVLVALSPSSLVPWVLLVTLLECWEGWLGV